LPKLTSKFGSIVAISLLTIALGFWFFHLHKDQATTILQPQTSPIKASGSLAQDQARPSVDPKSAAASEQRKTLALVASVVQVPALVEPNGTLQEFFTKSLESRSTKDVAMAFRLASKCSMAEIPQIEVDAQMIRTFSDRNHVDEIKVLNEVLFSRQALKSYCKSGDSVEFMERLRNSKTTSVGPIYRALVSGKPTEISQEYFQSTSQILSNPSLYPAELEVWLDYGLKQQLTDEFALNRSQIAFVQDQIYEIFAGNNGLTAPRQLIRCAQSFICPSSTVLSDSELVQAKIASDAIESRIRQQRWDLLIRRKN
jgi:hypothetical protein